MMTEQEPKQTESIFDVPQAVIAAAFQVDEVVIRYETPKEEPLNE